MSDIFQEVEEDLRRERLKRVWDRYGIFVILGAVLVVVVTAGWRGLDAWNTSKARNNGDAFSAVLQATDANPGPTSAAELVDFAGGAPAGYAMLARFRAATDYARTGEAAEAVTLLTDLSRDSSIPALYRDLATVRLGQTLLDENDPTGAAQTVAALAEDSNNAFTNAAQEVMGLAAYAQSDRVAAERWFTTLSEGAGVPQDMAQRARLMLALLAQTRDGGVPTAPSSASEPDDPEETN